MRRVIQIVPHLPPTISGVGDYALLLAGELRRANYCTTTFLLGNPDWNGPVELDGFPVEKLSTREAGSFQRLLVRLADNHVPVLLHYVGYGYQKRGCPFWLVRGLEAWQGNSGFRGLLTMFHELFAPLGAPWQSSFWTWQIQRWLVGRLTRISQVCRTNRRQYARHVECAAPHHAGQVTVQPVFSNVGEPENVKPLRDRSDNRLVLFGGGRWLDEALTTHRTALLAACTAMGIREVVAVGKPVSCEPQLPCKFEQRGILSPGKISELLSGSLVGFFNYFPGYLGKSGVFAAYCAHGLVPVSAMPNDSALEGLNAGEHFLVASELSAQVEMNRLQSVADNARGWYAEHSLARTAASVAAQLESLD